MARRKVVFPCGLTYETEGWGFVNTVDAFEGYTVRKALSTCPIHGKKCKR